MDVNMSGNFPKMMSLGELMYMQDGVLMKGREASLVMIEDSDQLESLAGELNPGSVAFLAGMGTIWQLDATGEWQSV